MRYLILAALAAFFSSAHAQSVPEVGQIVTVPLMVCDTEEAWGYVWDVHKDAGTEAGAQALNLLTEQISESGERLCGVMQGPWMILHTVRTGWLRFGAVEKWTVITRLQHQNGKFYFALLNSDKDQRTAM